MLARRKTVSAASRALRVAQPPPTSAQSASSQNEKDSSSSVSNRVAAGMVVDVEVGGAWLSDLRIHKDMATMLRHGNTAAAAEDSRGSSSALQVARPAMSQYFHLHLANMLLNTSSIGFQGCHGLLFHLTGQTVGNDVEAFGPTVRQVLQRANDSSDGLKELSQSQSALHVRLLALMCSYRSDDECLTETSAELEGAARDCALDVGVVVTLLKIAPPSVCMLLLKHQWRLRSGSYRTGNQEALSFETMSDFSAMIGALLNNLHFKGGDGAVGVSGMHESVLYFFEHHTVAEHSLSQPVRVIPELKEEEQAEKAGHGLPMDRGAASALHSGGVVTIFEDSLITQPGGNGGAASGAGHQHTFIRLMLKLGRAYTHCRLASEFVQVHQAATLRLPWLQSVLPCQYYMFLIGCQLDFVLGASPQCDDVRYWANVMIYAEEALSLYRRGKEADQLWLLVSKAARMMPCPAITTSACDQGEELREWHTPFHHLVAGAELFRRFDITDKFDKNGIAQVLRLYREAILANNNNAASSKMLPDATKQVMLFLTTNVTTKAFWLMDLSTTVLHSLKMAMIERNELLPESPSGGTNLDPDFAEAAKHVYVSLTAAIEVIGLGFELLKVGPLRKLLDYFGVSPKPTNYWWLCGCGAENVAESMRCTQCMRAPSTSGVTKWTCTSCKASQKYDVESCSCGVIHPSLAIAQQRAIDAQEDLPLSLAAITESDSKTKELPSHFVCTTCSWKNRGSAVTCGSCGEASPYFANKAGAKKLWLCNDCQSYSFNLWTKCGACKPPKTKVSGAITVNYFQWTCGCGRVNPSTRRSCAKCKDGKRTLFTCPTCSQPSGLGELEERKVDASRSIWIEPCTHCGTEHPRDRVVLNTASLPVNCVACGTKNKFDNSPGAPPASCLQCATALHNPHASWVCTECDARSDGYRCHNCSNLAPGVVSENAFLWRCQRTAGAEDDTQASIVASGDGDGTLEGEEQGLVQCNHWNPSWSRGCTECGAARNTMDLRHSNASGEERHSGETAAAVYSRGEQSMMDLVQAVEEANRHGEVRCRYIPWKCADCGNDNPASTVFECGHCETGRQEAPPCEKCGLSHLALSCPSPELLELADVLAEAIQGAQEHGEGV